MEQIIVDPSSTERLGLSQPSPYQYPPGVVLTQAGVPRRKPGRKPKIPDDSYDYPAEGASAAKAPPKVQRPRKTKDPNAPPPQRKRKAVPSEDASDPMDLDQAATARPAKITELASMRPSTDNSAFSSQMPPVQPPQPQYQQPPMRKPLPGFMASILNADPPSMPAPPAASKPRFDPVRGSYDPVREITVTRDPYGTGPLASPRAPSSVANHASASPSIASLVDPAPATQNTISSVPTHAYANPPLQPRAQETASVPLPPSTVPSSRTSLPSGSRSILAEARRPLPPAASLASKPSAKSTTSKPPSKTASKPAPKSENIKPDHGKPEPARSSFTPMSSIPPGVAAALPATVPAPAPSKKVVSVAQKERESKKRTSSGTSSPNMSSVKDKEALASIPALPSSERSILDFGKANPSDEIEAPTIVLHIPLIPGETNKYVNFMRMAEETYGWAALHPRLAANRERKARIAAASAALEKEKSGGAGGLESDEDAEDVSDAEVSNVEMNGVGAGAAGSGGPGIMSEPAKPARSKRKFKEDEYDKEDDFVDDSELLWEEQAAASRDGFFVYSGPLIPEVEKPTEAPRRGRGARGGRGGARGGARAAAKEAKEKAAAEAAAAAAAAGADGAAPPEPKKRRGGGPGSRGGTVRKPRITKQEKEQLNREKAEREKLADMASKSGASSMSASASLHSPTRPLAPSGSSAGASTTGPTVGLL